MQKYIFIILSFLFFSSCSIINVNVEKEPINLSDLEGNDMKISWLKLINDKKYSGRADIWAGGDLSMKFAFDQYTGDLWNTMCSFNPGNDWYILHEIVSVINTNEAIVQIPASASYTLSGTLYSVEIKNNELHRTRSGWGASKNNRPAGKDNPGYQVNDLTKDNYKQIWDKLTNDTVKIGTESLSVSIPDIYPNLPK